jgi:hypothetical protein
VSRGPFSLRRRSAAATSIPPPQPFAVLDVETYRRRRPETTTLHRMVREHLKTYLALANGSDPMGDGVPDHVEKAFRSYLTCGILAHGFARARCSSCGYGFQAGLWVDTRVKTHAYPACVGRGGPRKSRCQLPSAVRRYIAH